MSCNNSKSTHRKDQDNYQYFISRTVSLCERKNLLLNPQKSKEIVFKNINVKHKGLLNIKEERTIIQGSCVERTSYTMYLGVCIDDKLTFTNHISKMLAKVYYIVSTLAYTVPYFSSETKERVFTASILPTLVYAVPVWYHFVQVKDKNRIRSFLKFCSKIFRLNYENLVYRVNEAARNEFVRLAKNIQATKGHPLHPELNALCNKTNYNLRNPNITPCFRILLFKNSFIYRAAIFVQNGFLDPLL